VATKKNEAPAKKPDEAMVDGERAIAEGNRALVPLREKVATFADEARKIAKIRTEGERKLIAVTLVTNKDLQKEIKRVFKPMKEATDAAHKAVCDQENEQLEPLLEEEQRCKQLQNEDFREQERVAEEERKKLQAKADAKAAEARKKEVAALRLAGFRTVMEGVELTTELDGLFKAATGYKYATLSDDVIVALAEKFEAYAATKKADTPELRELFKALKKEGVKPDETAKVVVAASVQAEQVVVENRAQATASAAGLTFKVQKHMDVTDECLIERQYLSVNVAAIQAAGVAYWETIKPKDAKDAAAYLVAATKFAAWQGVRGVRFWVTKESVDTGRR